MTTTTEQQPRRAHLRDRLQELVAVRDELRADIDDPVVLSEFTAVQQQINRITEALWGR